MQCDFCNHAQPADGPSLKNSMADAIIQMKSRSLTRYNDPKYDLSWSYYVLLGMLLINTITCMKPVFNTG